MPSPTLIARAHAARLFVHPYTFRNEGQFLASDYRANPVEEYLQFYCRCKPCSSATGWRRYAMPKAASPCPWCASIRC